MTMTYNSLVTEILSYLDRDDESVVDNVPNFISQAEQRIARESKNIGFVKYVTGAFTRSINTYPKPGRWRRNVSFNCGSGDNYQTRNQVFLKLYEYIRMYTTDPVTEVGLPEYYADYNYSSFIVAPTPDQAYPFEYSYLELPEPLSLANQTNWLTNYAPDVLLYASLLEAIPFLKDDERIPIWESKYMQGLNSLNAQDDQRLADRNNNASAT
jgi:hypothetical protein